MINSLGQKDSGRRVYTVSELNQRVKLLLEAQFPALWVEGEISNLRQPSSGHIYFSLKDEESQLPAVMFRDAASLLPFRLEDGLKVIIFGQINVYKKRGQYQLVAAMAEPKGVGALQLALEQLKKKLAAEGLFDLCHKKRLPVLPERIGVVTSLTGAALRDILQVLHRRFSNVQVIVNPVPVQGEGAAQEIARALAEFNRWGKVDVLIVTRGGGSLEDLWAFNEEVVARSIFASRIPVISAVGHEIDWTISDLVADLRAPTPSAAAEMVVAQKSDLEERVQHHRLRLEKNWVYRFQSWQKRLEAALGSPVLQEPARLIRRFQQRVDEEALQLNRWLIRLVEGRRQRFNALAAHLEALNPLAVLARGYSFTRREEDGRIIKNSQDVKEGVKVLTRLHRGSFTSVVSKVSNQ